MPHRQPMGTFDNSRFVSDGSLKSNCNAAPMTLEENIKAGERQIANGETVTHEEAKQRLQKWLD
jgi:predicted transcriptional regulator